MSRFFGKLLLFCTLVYCTNCLAELTGELDASGSKYQPYTVALKYKNKYICSGSIISPTKILTAATCVSSCLSESIPGPKDCENLFSVYTGSPNLSRGGNVYRVKAITVPDGFKVTNLVNDIAVLTLIDEITYSDKEKPIGLPDKDIEDNSFGESSGWGVRSVNDIFSNDLKSFKKTIITAAKCNDEYFKEWKNKVDVNNFCTVSRTGFCQGDGGSPLIQDGKIIGISSWGIGCTRKYPDVYTNVYKYLQFIKKQME